MENQDLEKRIIELEEKFSHQDQLLNELNIVIARQEFVIEELVTNLNRMKESGNSNGQLTLENLKDNKPPHY